MKNTSVPIILLLFSFIHCTNHIDKYQVSLDSLQTLPDGCYAYRRGNVYVEDVKNERYRIWYSLTGSGNIKDITQIDDFKNTTGKTNNDKAVVINKYRIDTVSSKAIAQRFIEFSRKFRFGLLKIDKKIESSFLIKMV